MPSLPSTDFQADLQCLASAGSRSRAHVEQLLHKSLAFKRLVRCLHELRPYRVLLLSDQQQNEMASFRSARFVFARCVRYIPQSVGTSVARCVLIKLG